VWTTLGAVARETDSVDIGVGVTCPIIRYRPVILAQAAATVAAIFFFGVGTGERLNEHVTGEHWPEQPVRLEMLEEAVDVIRKLWTGEEISHYGEHYTVENAKLFTLPEEPPPIVVSAYGSRAAASAARIGDGLWSVGPQQSAVETFENEGGDGPKYSQMTVCYADSEDEAVETAHSQWRNSLLPGELNTELSTPVHFDQATQLVSKEQVREADSIVTDPDPQAHIENLNKFYDAGYDRVYVHQIGPNQEEFLDFYESEIVPEFA
jgi:G6PDH family F420-dependent oxidoreductase